MVCTSAYTWIQPKSHPIGSKHPVTIGLKNNIVKNLIVDYYGKVTSKSMGKNLQYAVWYFTNHIKSPNKTVTAMINYVKHHQVKIGNTYNHNGYTWTFNSIMQKNSQKIALFKVTKNKPKPPVVKTIIIYITLNNTINNTIYVNTTINNTVYINNTVNNTIYINNTINNTCPPKNTTCNKTCPIKPCPKPPVICKPKPCHPVICKPKIPCKNTCQEKCKC
jgi:hypothetical protein